jgi:hypothetical protein
MISDGTFRVFKGSNFFPALGEPVVIVTDIDNRSRHVSEYFAFFGRSEDALLGKRLRADKSHSVFSQGFVRAQALEFAEADLRGYLDNIHSESGDPALLRAIDLEQADENLLRNLFLRNQSRRVLDTIRQSTNLRPLIDHLAEIQGFPDLDWEDLF